MLDKMKNTMYTYNEFGDVCKSNKRLFMQVYYAQTYFFVNIKRIVTHILNMSSTSVFLLEG